MNQEEEITREELQRRVDELEKWKARLENPNPLIFCASFGGVVLLFACWVWGWALLQKALAVDDATSIDLILKIIAAFVGLPGIAVGYWLSWRRTSAMQKTAENAAETAATAVRQADIAEQGQATERFIKAVEQLGSKEPAIRLGGIYGLERLAIEHSERYRTTVMKILAAFVRAHKGYRKPKNNKAEKDEPKSRAPEDLQAALTTINFVNTDDQELDYQRSNLSGANLSGANLSGANLSGANLSGANLCDADLSRADLSRANLSGANLLRTQFRDAVMVGTNTANARNVKDYTFDDIFYDYTFYDDIYY